LSKITNGLDELISELQKNEEPDKVLNKNFDYTKNPFA